MTDGPDRPVRFPERAVASVAAAIRDQFAFWGVGPGDVVVTQGARGTDLLVAEAALVSGADSLVLLADRVDEFRRASVGPAGTDWSERFDRVLASSTIRTQPDELGPPPDGQNRWERNNDWALDVAVSYSGDEPPLAIVVWSSAGADSPGGTRDFLRRAQDRSIDTAIIDPMRARATFR